VKKESSINCNFCWLLKDSCCILSNVYLESRCWEQPVLLTSSCSLWFPNRLLISSVDISKLVMTIVYSCSVPVITMVSYVKYGHHKLNVVIIVIIVLAFSIKRVSWSTTSSPKDSPNFYDQLVNLASTLYGFMPR